MGLGDEESTRAASELSRRELLGRGAAAGAGSAVLLYGGPLAGMVNGAAQARSRRVPLARDGRFRWGVSSGFPMPRGITLWTRVAGLDRTSRLTLEVARDRDFRRVVERRRVRAKGTWDYTVHARVKGLDPDQRYFYRFATRNSSSRVGRFKTAPPPGSRKPIRIGFFSCQNYPEGYYTAHRALAQEEDLDLVICLGDYIYESGSFSGVEGRRDRSGDNRDGFVELLREYRQKYRVYQGDPDLIRMQGAHPMVAIWDDHEVENNFAGFQPAPSTATTTHVGSRQRRVTLPERRRNGYRAFFEAMPRIPMRGDGRRIYGRLGLGSLVDVLMLDTRSYRDPQPCDDEILRACGQYNEPRTLLGDRQKHWLKRRLTDSRATWKVLGNQVMMMALDTAPGLGINPDQWDGYARERREVLEHAVGNGVDNLVAVTGDIHTFFAGDLRTNGNITGRRAGVEIIGGSITSRGVPDTLGVPRELPQNEIAALLRANNPHLAYIEVVHKGYGVIEARRDELIAELKAVETIKEPRSRAFTLARFRTAAGSQKLERI